MALTLAHEPRISIEGFEQVLVAAGSPAAPAARMAYRNIEAYGIDPAVGLAFFHHESNYGQAGAARMSCNWGNIRKGGVWLSHHDGISADGKWLQYRPRPGEAQGSHYARAAADWAQLIRELYIERKHLETVEGALQVYAPAEDQNDPRSYAQCVIADVTAWTLAYPPVEAIPEPEPPSLEERVASLEARVSHLEDMRGIDSKGTPWGKPTSGVDEGTTTGAGVPDQ